MIENEISGIILDCAIEVHKTLGGPGLLESVYEEALVWEFQNRGIKFERQKQVPVIYKGQTLPYYFRLDIIVEEKVIIECKATHQYNKIYESQLLTYLRLTGLKLGIVINFGEKMLASGFNRVPNNL